ncbi:hypothetical protein F8M41_015431 [Gigaspora margarita]|uniref:Uncharacterized protein n=1 Tax=Gigaspora margarita TaxID=4874 RepID=A0A8H4A091_GIGMA|nr:hypothetical protein F8M41_015431 [Gigaspora margarita]
MFKFNPAEYKNKKIDDKSLINNHDKDQFKKEIIDLLTTILESKSNNKRDKDQFKEVIDLSTTIKAKLDSNNEKTLFCYRSNKTINDYLFQNIKISKIIEE